MSPVPRFWVVQMGLLDPQGKVTMDPLENRGAPDDELASRQQVYSVFDPDRVPTLDICTFDGVRRLQLAVSPDCSFRLVRDALNRATKSLDIYIYNASADHLLDLVRGAKNRGVAVRMMYDGMDTRGGERQKLRSLGVDLKEAPSSGKRQVFTVCHQKFVVIDGVSVMLGSANWAATSIPEVTVRGKFKKGNREWLVDLQDKRVASWFAALFQADWDIPEMELPQGGVTMPTSPALAPLDVLAATVTIPGRVFDIGAPNLGGSVQVTPILSPDNYFDLVRDLIRNATHSIDLEQQYIVATGPKTRGLLDELKARKAEVTIRIIVSPAFAKNWYATVETLSAFGLLDCLRAINLDSFTHLHNKGVLVDERYTIVTSTNMSENSITKAREAGVLIDSGEVAAYYKAVMDVDWEEGIDPADVSTHLTAVADALARVDEATVEIHPSDGRLI